MKEILQALIVLLIGIPFVYMAFDITVDIINRTSKRIKPVLVYITNTITSLLK